MTVGGAMLPTALGFSSLTRAGIATSFASVTASAITLSGYGAPGDRGAGCVYVRGTSAGPGAMQDAVGAWWQLPTGKPLDVTCFGAKLDSITDDTAATQAAVNAAAAIGGRVTIPGGNTTVIDQVDFPSSVSLSCGGSFGTIIKAKTATSTVFNATFSPGGGVTGNVHIDGCGFTSSTGGASYQTGGAFVQFGNCSRCRLSNFSMFAPNAGVRVTGDNMLAVFIDHGQIQGGAVAISIEGGADHFIDRIVAVGKMDGAPTKDTVGLLLANTGGTWITNSDFTWYSYGTRVSPGNGQRVDWTFASNTALSDNAWKVGLLLDPVGTGIVKGFFGSGTWVGTSRAQGVLGTCRADRGHTGTIEDLSFVNHRTYNSALDGMAFACGRNIRIANSSVIGSSKPDLGATTKSAPAIRFTNATHVSVLGSTFGSSAAFSANTASVSILVEGSSDYYRIRDNDFTDGFTAGTTGISDTAKGAHRSIGDNFP